MLAMTCMGFKFEFQIPMKHILLNNVIFPTAVRCTEEFIFSELMLEIIQIEFTWKGESCRVVECVSQIVKFQN